jgi:hypothetical protein
MAHTVFRVTGPHVSQTCPTKHLNLLDIEILSNLRFGSLEIVCVCMSVYVKVCTSGTYTHTYIHTYTHTLDIHPQVISNFCGYASCSFTRSLHERTEYVSCN